MNTDTWTRRFIFGALAVLIAVLATACGTHHASANPTTLVPTGAASSAHSAIQSIQANPTTSADIAQAKALVKSCFAGTPLQQAHQVHLVFLSSATGKHGPDVVAARDKLASCLGISKSDEQPFFNDAVTAAEHANPKLTTHDGRVQYFEVTLPGLVLKYSKAGYTPPASPGAGTVPGASPSPSA
jgi:hypothetical protein